MCERFAAREPPAMAHPFGTAPKVVKPNSKKLRERTKKAAEALLGDEFQQGPDASGSSSNNPRPGRSHPASGSGDISSHMFKPQWRRLLRAMAPTLAQRFEESDVSSVECCPELRQVLLHPDGVGGGSERDVKQLLAALVEAAGFDDAGSGFLLLRTYHHLQAWDLPCSPRTWRTLLLTAVTISAGEVSTGKAEGSKATSRLFSHVAHWWSTQQAQRACELFTDREIFRSRPASRSVLARLYFELRETALRMGPEEEPSTASAVFLSDVLTVGNRSPEGKGIVSMTPSWKPELPDGCADAAVSWDVLPQRLEVAHCSSDSEKDCGWRPNCILSL